MDPDIVFWGLILVSFLPLKIFPNNKPPISENIQIVKLLLELTQKIEITVIIILKLELMKY